MIKKITTLACATICGLAVLLTGCGATEEIKSNVAQQPQLYEFNPVTSYDLEGEFSVTWENKFEEKTISMASDDIADFLKKVGAKNYISYLQVADNSSSPSTEIVYALDNDRNIVGILDLDYALGEENFGIVFNIDDNDRIVKISNVKNNEEITFYAEISYYDTGMVESVSSIWDFGDGPFTDRIMEFDEKGKEKSVLVVDEYAAIRDFEYYDNGIVKKTGDATIEFNAEGRRTKDVSNGLLDIYIYHYGDIEVKEPTNYQNFRQVMEKCTQHLGIFGITNYEML